MSNSSLPTNGRRHDTQLVSTDVDFDEEGQVTAAIMDADDNDDNENGFFNMNGGRRALVIEAQSNGCDATLTRKDNSDRRNNNSGLHQNNDATSDSSTKDAAENTATQTPFRRRCNGGGIVVAGAVQSHHRHKTQESSRFAIPSSSATATTRTPKVVTTNKGKKSYEPRQPNSGTASLIQFTIVMAFFLIGFESIRNARSNHEHLDGKHDNQYQQQQQQQNRFQKQNEDDGDKRIEQNNLTSVSIGSATPSTPVVVGEQQREEELGTGHDRCGIWMAPSSIRPYPGYGIFTTRQIKSQDYILHGPDAVSIPLHDMRTTRKGDHELPLYEERRRVWRNVFSNVCTVFQHLSIMVFFRMLIILGFDFLILQLLCFCL